MRKISDLTGEQKKMLKTFSDADQTLVFTAPKDLSQSKQEKRTRLRWRLYGASYRQRKSAGTVVHKAGTKKAAKRKVKKAAKPKAKKAKLTKSKATKALRSKISKVAKGKKAKGTKPLPSEIKRTNLGSEKVTPALPA